MFKNYSGVGVNFITSDDMPQQLAHMAHPKGKMIPPHIHTSIVREINLTQEVLIVKKGAIRVDLYSDQKVYIESWVLGVGDIILLASGGHGFEVLEDLEMYEIKQGPYLNNQDKVRFISDVSVKLNIKNNE